MPSTILLIAPASTAEPVAAALRSALDLEVEIAFPRKAALASLRRHEVALVLIDEGLAGEDQQFTDQLYRGAEAAPLLEINFSLSNAERIVRQARSALVRRTHDRTQAHAAAALALRSELNAALAGLLLESELALRDALPPQQPKLRRIVLLAADLRDRLRV
jgi:hypothetical protein